MTTFGFIGTGNMGGAMARAVAEQVSGAQLYLANRTPAKAQKLAQELGAHYASNEECAVIHQAMRGLGVVQMDHQARV